MKIDTTGSEEVEITFKTTNESYALPDDSIRINAEWDAENLNNLVNSILEESQPEHKPVPFDFFFDGNLFKTSISALLEQHGLSKEGKLIIEYEPRLSKPKSELTIPHGDWISCIKALSPERIAVGCYDNSVSLCSINGKKSTGIVQIDKLSIVWSINDIDWLSSDQIISCSDDCTLRIWTVDEYSQLSVTKVIENPALVKCVSVSPDGKKILSGLRDHSIRMWITDQVLASGDSATTDENKTDMPLVMMENAHNGIVTDVKWLSDNEALSCSWDWHIRSWDMNTATEIRNVVLPYRAFWSISYSPVNRLILSAAADPIIRLYDIRSSDGEIVKNQYFEHKSIVYDVCWCVCSPNYFASAGKDGLVKVWDIRNNKSSLYNIARHGQKALTVDWSLSGFVISGGEDKNLRISTFAKA